MSRLNPIRERLKQVHPIKSTIDHDGHSVTLSEDDYDWMRSQIETTLHANERAMARVIEANAISGRDRMSAALMTTAISAIGEDIADALGDGSE